MSVARAFGRATSKAPALAQTTKRSSFTASPSTHSYLHLFSNRFQFPGVPNSEASLLRNLAYTTSSFQQVGFSTSASPEHNGKAQSGQEQTEIKEANASAGGQEEESKATTNRKNSTETEQKQDTDSEGDLDDISREDLIKLLTEKEEMLQTKQKEIAAMQDKVLRDYAEMENVMDRTRRDAENSKKFAIQNFAKNLLDVADNLGRASSVVKESFAKIDGSQDITGTGQLLKTFLEGVEMTEKQLIEVFRKFGVEKYDPTNEQFNPNRHNAVFQVPDNSKPSGTVAVVLKSGYVLHDRVIRPAEVGVTQAAEDGEAQ